MTFSKLATCVKCLIGVSIALIIGGLLFIYSGVYPMGADVPHNKVTYWAIETLRERSIANASSEIQEPKDLNTSERLLAGGADYNDMCSACHLKPGQSKSDFTQGLYPVPPNLSVEHQSGGDIENLTKRQFWIIKHGIKASGMPAWGPTHDDERIWNMVAFLQRLPEFNCTWRR